jgi:endonuclease/exonuclease/phosphatase family metal-dependent hydrolase
VQESLFQKLTGHLENTYVKLDFASILFVKLAVFVHRRHIAKIRFVEKADVALGIGNVIGNKGAVAIALQFNDTSFCFIGCHLAAHEHNMEQRNRQYHAIVRALKMGMPRCDVLNQFDHVVWCGDLNYRVNVCHEEALALIAHRNLPKLLMADQLLMARAKGEVFLDHAEGPIVFPPTFKMADNCRKYDPERVPSWCDRILWKSVPCALPMRMVEYGCSEILTSSDHRPVFGVFRAGVQLPPNPARTTPLGVVFHGPVTATGLIPPEGHKDVDPVLVFRAPFLNPRITYHSKVKKATTNPVWAEGDIKDIVTCISDPTYLARQHLTVFVLHIDRELRQELLGQCVIPLGGASPTPFSSRITLEGRHVGILNGHACVIPAH